MHLDHVGFLEEGTALTHEIGEGRGAYVYLIGGRASFDGERVTTGDAAKVSAQPSVTIRADAPSELILVDVPMKFEPVGTWRGRVG